MSLLKRRRSPEMPPMGHQKLTVLCCVLSAAQLSLGSNVALNGIAASKDYSCGVTTAGVLDCWGMQVPGREVSRVADYLNKTYGVNTSEVVWSMVSSAEGYSCGLTSTGLLGCWGQEDSEALVLPAGKTWASVSAGPDHACGVTTVGEGLCWGENSLGQCNVPIGRVWSMIAAGYVHSCGVTTDGNALCWDSTQQHSDAVQAGAVTVPVAPATRQPYVWAGVSAGYQDRCAVLTAIATQV